MMLGSEQSFTFFDFQVLRFGCGGGFGTIPWTDDTVKLVSALMHAKKP